MEWYFVVKKTPLSAKMSLWLIRSQFCKSPLSRFFCFLLSFCPNRYTGKHQPLHELRADWTSLGSICYLHPFPPALKSRFSEKADCFVDQADLLPLKKHLGPHPQELGTSVFHMASLGRLEFSTPLFVLSFCTGRGLPPSRPFLVSGVEVRFLKVLTQSNLLNFPWWNSFFNEPSWKEVPIEAIAAEPSAKNGPFKGFQLLSCSAKGKKGFGWPMKWDSWLFEKNQGIDTWRFD